MLLIYNYYTKFCQFRQVFCLTKYTHISTFFSMWIKNLELYDIQYVQIVYIQYICIYMYSLSSITAGSLIGELYLTPPNTIIQLVVGVTLQTERE